MLLYISVSCNYNDNGDIIKVTNSEGNSRLCEYNLDGKVTKITDFNGAITEDKYNVWLYYNILFI